MITFDDFELFCRRSFAGVLGVVGDLGDDLVNAHPESTGGSSPFALVTHIVGACEWWVGHILLGEPSTRDRDAEFAARGTVTELDHLVSNWLESLSSRKPSIVSATTLAGSEPSTQIPLDGEWTVGAVLMHVYEELAQHLGHLEVTADILHAENH